MEALDQQEARWSYFLPSALIIKFNGSTTDHQEARWRYFLPTALIIKFNGSNRPPRGTLEVLFTHSILLLGCNSCAGQRLLLVLLLLPLCVIQ